MIDNDTELERIAEEEQARIVAEHDAALVEQLERAYDPDAYDPARGLRVHRHRTADVQWAARRLMAHEAALRALPWVKRQCLAAFHEGLDAADGRL